MSAAMSPVATPVRAALPVLALCVLMSVAVQASMLTTPLLTMHVFDGVLESRNLETLWVLAAAMLVILLLGGLLRHLRAAMLAALSERVGRKLELRALAASVRVALGGERAVAGRALQDVAELRRLLGGTVPVDILDLVSIPIALVVLWMLHPLFFVVALVSSILQGLIGIAADRATRGPVQAAAQQEGRGRRDLSGQLAQRELVLGLGLLPVILARFAPMQSHVMADRGVAEGRARALSGLLQLAVFAQQLATVAVGVTLLLAHAVSPGAMIAAATMTSLATQPVVHLVSHWRDWGDGIAAAQRLAGVVRRGRAPDAVPAEAGGPPGLRIEGLTLRPEGRTTPLVAGMTIDLPPGTAWVVAGPNGIGKSTLLRAVLGLAAPEEGRVLLDGQDTLRSDRATLGPRIGYLPQEPQLLDGSVLENVGRFAADGTGDVVTASRLVGAHVAIGRLPRGYESLAGPDAGLSGGQTRLVALARAFHGTPRLLVLDEPEAGLDNHGRATLRQAVVRARDGGAVVLLVSHDPAAWSDVADGALRLAKGGAWTQESMA
ncbi:ATP-binding cassette domain-containing protein [Roseomonas terrae]|jgi:ABC-type protease/lipase transport system fused ATPase/permease subunit|uniref:ATP-binding cassette domain-containing protein n=1 Tax=Neoroseomonas terrae TaxID=424799 RepID=A0ABS5EGU3_9PROT|nr:ATP-binding cassette domain-containing protein [Neoroseomonas terrae]MBR0650222.1 ATP-binding cassette domain-containing protein [Neoroseomonas terrae]